MANNIIKGRKGGGSKQRTPTEKPDDLQSVAKAKILLALGEGEFAGGLTGKDIYLDGTPLENADGSQNFSGVSWEFRPGTQAQTYIQGIPGTENEISVGTEVSSKTAWTHTFTNTQLSAVRVRLKWPSLMKQEDDGDVVGNTVKYAIDLQTDGGAWQTVLETAVTGKTTSGYERSHRIDLPHAGSTWTLRLRKISPDANSVKVGDVMTLQSYTEVIDAKLRYPNTALLYIEFDSSQFNGSIPQISCEPRGRVIRVPDNYNPETREYTGVWTGGFKWAWTDNPAWIYYDIVTADRFGLGNRLSSANISKWTLYQIAQYCDQLVPDGRGGDGMEPRYTCNVYVQERNDAYTVLRDFAAIFRGMTCWNGEQIVVQADMPRDVDFTYTRANIVGKPRYSSSSSQVRYTNALVSWSDPDNAYADAMEPAFIPELVSRYSFNQLEMTAIGCTRQSEAHRKGLWGILTNNKDRVVEFDVGLDGRIPQPGYIIALADELLAGRVNGGRISAVNGRVITLDRDVDAKPGDRLQLNLPSGISQSRTIQAVNGRRQITVTTAYSETPERECVWAIESDDLFLQQYRVTGVKENSDATLTITGVAHDPDKFARIDTGAIIDQRPVSVLPAGNQSPPDDIVITSRSVVNQGISVETMQVTWSAVSGAIAYEAQWRRNDGNWINVPRSSTTSFEVSGIYAGRYLVRVRAINAVEISSGWAYSEEKTLTGKVGEPLAPLALATRSLVHGVQVSWEFPTGSGDTLRTELQYSKNQDGSAPMPLSDVAYPGKSYQQMGLSMGAEFWYRARLVDRLGNESPWTGWVQGMASNNFDDYYENLTNAIKDTDAWEETQRTISETQEGIRNTQQELEQTAEELRQEAADQAKQVSQDIDASAKSITADVDGKISAVNKTITDELTSVNESLDSGLAQANKGIQEAKSAVADANQQIAILSKSLADGDAALNAQIKTAENGLKQSLSQVNTTLTNAVKQETADRIADVNAKAAQAADELLAATQGIEANIESLTQVMKSADENLAREMSSLAAGANIQFDSQVIWHFNNQTTEGWTGSAGVPGVSQDGWLRPADSATDPYITSPGGLAVDGAAYRFIMLRFRKTGKPVWAGEIRWVSAGENFNNTKRYIVAEPEYADGVATLTVRDIPWTGNIDRIRLDLTNQQDASNFIEFDWIAVGRPAPGASTAALQDVRSTLSNALTAEAQARSTLAAQMRGSYEGSDLEKVTSGLLYQEKTARVTAISAEVKARESLQTQFNDNKAAVSGELSSLTTEQSAQASRIGGLETSLGKKADATALTSLTQKVEQQGATLTSQGAALTSLTNRVGQTETGLAGTNEALSGLESTVTQQGDRITSQGQSITKLTSDLGTTNAALAKKAEAAAVTALTQQVEQNGQDIRSNTDSITSLSNQLVNGQPNSWSRRIYPVQLANAGTVPSFSDIRAVAPVVVDEVSDAAKLDFTSAGSYLIALYSCQVKVAADTTITMAPGNRIFDDTGAVFVNGVQVAWGNASWTTGSFELKVGWNTVEFLVNQWTGQAYINLGLKLSDKVAEMYSGLGVSALANAAGVLSSNVSQIGNDVVSNSQSITQLRNALTQTDANVASKADQTAMNSLTGRVEKTESGLTAANSNITSLSSSLSQQSKRGANLLPDGTFESYAVGHNLANNRAIVTTDDSHGGNKCIRVTRPNDYNANATDNTDTHIFSGFQVRDNAVFYMECWVKLDAKSTAMAENVQISVGLSLQYQDNSWQWPAVTRAAKDLSTAQWTKVSGYLKSTKSGIKQAMVRISIPNVSSVKAGNSFLIDDLVITEVTDAYNAQSTADANANVISTLDSTVSQQGDQITSQGNSITKLTNDLATTNNNVSKKADQSALSVLSGRVDQTESGLSSANSSITALNSSVRAGNATSGDLISNPTFDPEFSQMGFTVVSSSSEGVPANCPYAYVARIAARDHHPNFAAIPATLGDVYEMSALVACGTGSADFNLYLGTATRPSGSVGAPLSSGGNRKASATWQRVTWRFKITQGIVDRGFFRPFLQINQSSPFGTVWFVTDWHMRNVTAAQKVQDTADATAAAVDSLTTTVTQQGNLLTSTGNRTTQLENGLATTNAAVAKKADATAVQDLTNTLKQLGNDLTAANSAITKLTGNLANTDKALAQKADATALATLDTKVTQQGKTLESQSNSLTNLSNSLSQVAADIDASGQIPGNLVVNPSFERGLDGYTGRSTATSVVEVSAPHSGTRALKVDPGSVSPGQYIPFVQGRTYEIGVWVKEPGATTDNGAGNNKLRIGNSAGQPVFERPYNSGTVGTNWSLISGRWKATETASLPVTMSNYLISGSRYFDDFYVTDVTDRVDIDATAGAVTGLTNRVSTAEGHITSQSQQLTNLQNSLNTTNAALAKKAEASAVTALTQQVEQNGQDIRSNTNSITSLSNQLVNGQPNSWSRRIYPVQLANAGTVPSFSDIRAVAPVVVDEVADAAKLDFTSAGSYLIALYSCQVKVAADTTIAMAPGNRIFDDTGAVFVNGVQVAWGNASWTTGSFELKVGWNTVEFLVNQWTGQAYINLGLKLSDKVAEMYSGLGVSALANAAGVLSSNVSQIGNDVVSNSQSITQLRNALTQTDANVASKADQTAMNSLTGRVEKTESGLTAANSNITSLSSSLSQQSKRGANLLPDGTFESYAVGHNLANNRAIVTTDDSHGGNKCIRVTRPNDYNANATDNTDTHIFSGFQVRDNAVFYMECWVKLDAKSTAMAENVQISVGLSLQYQDNSWQWPAVTRAAKDLSTAQWTKVSGYLKSTKSGIKQAMVRISIPNVSSVKAGNSFLIDDLVITEVTDAYNAQSTADANANAISTLNSTVSQQGDQITSQGNSITKLTNDLATTNNNVSNKADANALTALTNRVTQTEKDINSTSSSVTNLNNKVDSISVGGTNLIKNSGDMTGWSNVTSETYRGNAVIGATVKAGSGYKDLREIALESPVDAGEYVYSFYAKGGVAGQTMTAFFYNPNTTTSIETSQGAKGNNTDGRAYFTLTTSWVRYWVKWKQTPTTGTKRLILCRIESNTSKDQTVYINSPKFEVGNVVSDWNDSPADSASASAVDLLTTTVNQQGTSISSIGNRTTSLENGLSTAQNNIARKADASALQDLRNTVTSQGGDLTAANSSITSLQASMNRRTVFTVTARGNGNSVTPGVFDESGKNLFTPGRSWALVTFAKHSDGSTVIATSKTYDVFGSANNGATMSADIEALASGTYVCVLTFDEPSGNRGKILSALESLGGTSEVVNSLPYRGAYILLGRKGMRSGDGLELRAPTGGDATAHISTSVEFVNGIMMGLGAAGGVMMKADANASAITTLQNTVKTQGGNIDSLSSSITALENSLRSTNDTVSKKADTTAVSSLTGRVSQVENTITSQSQSITSLTSSINTISTQGANPWVDGTFESYGDGHVLGGGGTAVVVASQKFTGNKSLQVSRGANNNGNSDKQLGSWQSVREDAKFRFEFWAMMPADQAPSSGWTTLVGINSLNAAGQNSWQSAVTVSEAALGARDKWVKFTGIASNNGGGRTRAVVWISTRGASGSGTPGYSLYIDDLVITDVTDAKAAQDASDATASAVSSLMARVTDAEGKITAQAQQQTALATKVDNANSRVDNMAKTLSDSQSTQASLNTSLQSQIDAQAAANIKNQTTLDNTIKSVASITSTQQTHATALEALATQQTTLTSSVGDLSASVQNTAKTVADVNGTVSSLWSMKVETVNGKNVGAGITLGSNGETSDMILYADRFSLFNRNNATAVPVMVAEGNELYIDTARIKNSSLTSTKIADGSITNAKIGNEIRSNDFVDGSRGWRIAKDGSSQFNNVIVRGAVYATDGWFQGTVYANHIEGDIGSFAINIAQHRTRKVPKATWQWFELARFRRQNFDQVINIRGGLLQTDSITIDGGAKLRAGMSYAPGADGGLNPGYLSYAMLLRGTGATSGGGSMELGIELMYETGGATRLLTAQESMNVDNMSFVVPAGTGDAVLRYGCYLDRNGQMVLTILSRFDAFAARNNNVIRGSST
ncbi:TipJ family phage tail tip protein [Klebsiella pneumoniae]|uniref:TipJ family phage tail tip protein n=1 Tax=Klebsiella pneumoniae TaxID=573 RepID=UPI003B2870CD